MTTYHPIAKTSDITVDNTPALAFDRRTLVEMLTYMRPHGSAAEAEFIERWLRPLADFEDEAGNLVTVVPTNEEGLPTVIWTAHTDTVHRASGYQRVVCIDNVASLKPVMKPGKTPGDLKLVGYDGSCLGADDTAGIWLMLNMIAAEVPGMYVFHRGEEKGCIGSSAFVERFKDDLASVDAVISFDRRGTRDIITHQMGVRTCSTAFAKSLAKAIGLGHKPCDGGSYTDSNEYAHVVSECTNVAVGYYSQHSSAETLDVAYLERLAHAMCKIDIGTLVIERDPSTYDSLYTSLGATRNTRGTAWDEYGTKWWDSWSDEEERTVSAYDEWNTLVKIVQENAADVADLLLDMGYSTDGVVEMLYMQTDDPTYVSFLEDVKSKTRKH